MKLSFQSFLVFRLNTVVCAIPLKHVSEVMRPLPLDKFASLPHFYAGVSVIRGIPTPVLDLKKTLGVDDEETPSRRERFVLVDSEKQKIACLVDEVLGIEDIDPQFITKTLGFFQKANRDLITGMGTLDQKLLLVLESLVTLPEEFRKDLQELKASNGV